MWNRYNPHTNKTGTLLFILSVTALLGFSVLAAAAPIDQDQSLEAILEKLAHHRYNQDNDTVLELQAYIRVHRQTPEGRTHCEKLLLELLQGEATEDGKWEACRQLRSLGSDASVPVLKKMLTPEETSEMARYALEKIPGTAADRAILGALGSSSGKIRLGLISSLGHRSSRQAVAGLARIAGEPDEEAAVAAVTALGRIATQDAALSLVPFLKPGKGQLRISAAASLLKCAEVFQAAGETDMAFQFYRQLLGSDVSLSTSRAALQGWISISGDKGRDLILEVLQNPDPGMHSVAIGMVSRVFDAADILPLCELLPRLPVQSRVQLITILSSYQNDVVLITAAQTLSSPELDVRLAALRALGKQGNASSARLLVRQAARSRGVEQAAARTALWNLRGAAVDGAILEALSQENDHALRRELVRSLGERRVIGGKSLLVDCMQDPDPGLRLDAIRALGQVAEPQDLPLLIDQLLELENETEQNELANTFAATARKINRPYARAGLVTNRLRVAPAAEDRKVLLMVLGKIGDDSSLRVLRRALEDPNTKVQEAAARALIEWPTATARDDVFKIAEASSHPTLQVLAVRAYVRMVGMERFRRPEAAVTSLEFVLPLVTRPQEKMAILGILPQFSCQEALALAERFLADDSVAKEAQAAVDRLRRSLR
ncbi:MAG: HEAT repeat domain-containing protein [Candidatus Aminicenantaceae bacterium]